MVRYGITIFDSSGIARMPLHLAAMNSIISLSMVARALSLIPRTGFKVGCVHLFVGVIFTL